MRLSRFLMVPMVAVTMCTARASILYWTFDGPAGESLTSAFLETLTNADGNSDNVVARLYSTDSATSERIDYEPAVGLESEDNLGVIFYGWPDTTVIPADSAKSYGVELGVLNTDGSITAYFTSEMLSYDDLLAKKHVQSSEVGVYDEAWNLAAATWTSVAVPEPAVAALFLLGVFLLRRNRHA